MACVRPRLLDLKGEDTTKTIGVVSLLLVVILGLIFIEKDFNLEAEGTLVPIQRREVFAPIDGEVLHVLVDHDDPVEAGDLLVSMINRDLEIQLPVLSKQVKSAYKNCYEKNSYKQGMFLELIDEIDLLK